MNYRLKTQKRYYLYMLLLEVILIVSGLLLFRVHYLAIIITLAAFCPTSVLTVRYIVKIIEISLTPETIEIAGILGISRIKYDEVQKITLSNRGVSMLALAQEKVQIAFKKEEFRRASKITLSLENAEEFVESVKKRL